MTDLTTGSSSFIRNNYIVVGPYVFDAQTVAGTGSLSIFPIPNIGVPNPTATTSHTTDQAAAILEWAALDHGAPSTSAAPTLRARSAAVVIVWGVKFWLPSFSYLAFLSS